jgi:hypothetical protein
MGLSALAREKHRRGALAQIFLRLVSFSPEVDAAKPLKTSQIRLM